MKYYEVEFKRNYEDGYANWIGDLVEADNEEEAEDLAKTWLIEHGEEDVDDLYMLVTEVDWSLLSNEQFAKMYDSCDIYCDDMDEELCWRVGLEDKYAYADADSVEDVIFEARQRLNGKRG